MVHERSVTTICTLLHTMSSRAIVLLALYLQHLACFSSVCHYDVIANIFRTNAAHWLWNDVWHILDAIAINHTDFERG